jgi:hypothetical protein
VPPGMKERLELFRRCRKSGGPECPNAKPDSN